MLVAESKDENTGAPLPMAVDVQRTVVHDLGFCPMVWIRNLPGGDDVDGLCTFSGAIENSIEIDYQLSQSGRGLKYSSDPTLLLKEPAQTEGEMVKGGGSTIVVGDKGDGKMLEISGNASAAVIEYVRVLREFALEAKRTSRPLKVSRSRLIPCRPRSSGDPKS
jgi:hypothetical protein